MRTQSNGKIRRSEAEWREILERYERSGLSAVAFCRRAKLSTNTFAKWKRVLSGGDSKESGFVELTPRPSPTLDHAARAEAEFELSLPGGVMLRWKA